MKFSNSELRYCPSGRAFRVYALAALALGIVLALTLALLAPDAAPAQAQSAADPPSRIVSNGLQLRLAFDRDIKTSSNCPATTAFTLTVDGEDWESPFLNPNIKSTGPRGWVADCSAREVLLQLPNSDLSWWINSHRTITLSYDPTKAQTSVTVFGVSSIVSRPITYTDGVQVPAFTNMAVENLAPDLREPSGSGAGGPPGLPDPGEMPPPPVRTLTDEELLASTSCLHLDDPQAHVWEGQGIPSCADVEAARQRQYARLGGYNVGQRPGRCAWYGGGLDGVKFRLDDCPNAPDYRVGEPVFHPSLHPDTPVVRPTPVPRATYVSCGHTNDAGRWVSGWHPTSGYCHCPVRSNGEESYYVGNDRCAFGIAGLEEARRYIGS